MLCICSNRQSQHKSRSGYLAWPWSSRWNLINNTFNNIESTTTSTTTTNDEVLQHNAGTTTHVNATNQAALPQRLVCKHQCKVMSAYQRCQVGLPIAFEEQPTRRLLSPCNQQHWIWWRQTEYAAMWACKVPYALEPGIQFGHKHRLCQGPCPERRSAWQRQLG